VANVFVNTFSKKIRNGIDSFAISLLSRFTKQEEWFRQVQIWNFFSDYRNSVKPRDSSVLPQWSAEFTKWCVEFVKIFHGKGWALIVSFCILM